MKFQTIDDYTDAAEQLGLQTVDSIRGFIAIDGKGSRVPWDVVRERWLQSLQEARYGT